MSDTQPYIQEHVRHRVELMLTQVPDGHPYALMLRSGLHHLVACAALPSYTQAICEEYLRWAQNSIVRMRVDMAQQETERTWHMENGSTIHFKENRDHIRPWTFRERLVHMPDELGKIVDEQRDEADVDQPPAWLLWGMVIVLAILVAGGFAGWWF